MNSLEFIDIEIARTKSKYKEHIKFGQTAFAIKDEKRLNTLQQIKSKLEAWNVMNEEFIIKPYYQQGKYPAIMIRHPIEDDEVVCRGVKQEKYDKVLKALEVKENVD